MEVTITLQYGPLDAEFTGEDREEIQEEVIGFIEFIEEEEEQLSNLPTPSTDDASEPTRKQTAATGWDDSSPPDEAASPQPGASEFQSLASKTGADAGDLAQLYDLPDDEEGVPSLNMYHFDEGVLELGNARNQRQAQASALLLYAWEECIGEKKIKYEQLNEALVASDIETERMDHMLRAFSGDAEDWFESDGSQIHLLGQGKNHTRDLLEDLVEKMNE